MRVDAIFVGTVVIASVSKVLYCCAPEDKPLRNKAQRFCFDVHVKHNNTSPVTMNTAVCDETAQKIRLIWEHPLL